MEFGEFLAKLRKERGILQKELANYLNVTVATISNYEKGIHSPDLNTLIKLASMDMLNHQLSMDYTLSDLINTTLELDQRNTIALLDYYELLTLRNSINRVK